MTRRAPWLRWSAVMLLVPAFAASMPTIQFCQLTADGSSRLRFAGCLEPGMLVAEVAFENSAAAPAPAPTPTPVEPANRVTACSEGSCPLAAREHAACSATCAAVTTVPARSASAPSPSRHVRVYCLGDPAGGRALRSHTPLIATPGPLVAWLAFAATVTPNEAPAQTEWPELAALAPARLATARPPVRAPPARV